MPTRILHDLLSENFPLYQVSLSALEEISEIAETLTFRRNEILFAEGKIANSLFVIESGNLLSYSDNAGQKNVNRFWFSNQPVILLPSLITKSPLASTIVALNECKLFAISFAKLTNLAQQSHQIAEIINLLFALEATQLFEYIYLLKVEPAERFKNFMQTHPTLIQVATADLIASYLNMGYSTFARYRQSRIL
ncbi:Crp/Fnr family transcriptional regulator [Pedobacter namyangjuensis]|uniref:Crp/Fnr family transcriptional regulator n=1 Tax=Pedobacter namyangjuensis TaxID=600626 RepID=UPI000DE1EE21|nr:Crp/Fnr family transcriptional regulator [Pedobacter namyangjuensis]